MTDYTNTTVEQRVAAYHAEYPPLPSAADLAAPIIQGIIVLTETFMNRTDAMTRDLEQGDGFEAEARELVDTVNRVAALVRSIIHGHLYGKNRALTFDTDSIVRALCDSAYVESVLNRPDTDACDPMITLDDLDNSIEAIGRRTTEMVKLLQARDVA